MSDTRKGTRFIYLDIKDHFVAIPIFDLECMRVQYKYILPDRKSKYNIDQLITNDRWVCIKI